MARLTITKAIEQSPIGKTHFYKQYIDTGKITVSVDNAGKKFIDSSELIRVFGELKGEPSENVQEQPTVSDTVLPNAEQGELVNALREQIADLKSEREFYQSQVITLTNRLEAPAVQPTPSKRQSRISKWWYGLDDKE